MRYAAVAAMEDEAGTGERLTPLIEMTFRATWIIAMKMRGEMLDAGRGEELDELVAAARALHAEVLDGAVE